MTVLVDSDILIEVSLGWKCEHPFLMDRVEQLTLQDRRGVLLLSLLFGGGLG